MRKPTLHGNYEVGVSSEVLEQAHDPVGVHEVGPLGEVELGRSIALCGIGRHPDRG